MDIQIRDKVRQKSLPAKTAPKGDVIAITHWALEAEDGPAERWDIGIRSTGSDRILWLDSGDVLVTKKAG